MTSWEQTRLFDWTAVTPLLRACIDTAQTTLRLSQCISRKGLEGFTVVQRKEGQHALLRHDRRSSARGQTAPKYQIPRFWQLKSEEERTPATRGLNLS